jgi:hypothetical protein
VIETPYRDVRGTASKITIQRRNSARYCSFASGSKVAISNLMRSGVVSAAKMSFFSGTFSRHNFSETALGPPT